MVMAEENRVLVGSAERRNRRRKKKNECPSVVAYKWYHIKRELLTAELVTMALPHHCCQHDPQLHGCAGMEDVSWMVVAEEKSLLSRGVQRRNQRRKKKK